MRQAADGAELRAAPRRCATTPRRCARCIERNAVVLPDDGSDADVFALVSDDAGTPPSTVFHVRGGRVRGHARLGRDLSRRRGRRGHRAAPRQVYVDCRRLRRPRRGSRTSSASHSRTPPAPRAAPGECAWRRWRRPRAWTTSRTPPTIGDPARGPGSRSCPRTPPTVARLAGRPARRVRRRCARAQARRRRPQLMDTVTRERRRRLAAAPHEARGRHHGALEGTRGARREPRPARARPCASSATTSRTRAGQQPGRPPWSSSRTVCRARTTYRTLQHPRRGRQRHRPTTRAAMNEVLTRRFSRLLAEEGAAVARSAGARTASPLRLRPDRRDDRDVPSVSPTGPSLVVVDGGLPQVNAARAALDDAWASDVPVVGLAKRLEEVWIPGDDFPAHPAAHVGGSLPPAVPARRVPPLRDHEAPRAPVEGPAPLGPRLRTQGLDPTRQAALLKRFRLSQADSRGHAPSGFPRSRAWDSALRARSAIRLAASSREDTP